MDKKTLGAESVSGGQASFEKMVEERLSPLVFEGNSGNFEAKTPVGRYFIDKNGDDYESYSDIEEIGADPSPEEAFERVRDHHKRIILNCLT